ncbi:uncharacterized protein [Temnothorax nylanderi]|uniref:uncharacterized protein n=1 Tax=Temnothorax nylanderi TaxID=102681 RepID=UPI003A8C34F3
MSAQEAVYHVLGLPLSLCSRALVYINTIPQKERVLIGDAEIDNALTQAQRDQQEIEDEEEESFMKIKIQKEQEIDIFGQTGVADCSKESRRKISSPPKATKEEMMNILQKLNDKQREIAMHILHCFKTNNLPIKLYISGSAGVGKSTVINAIYQLLLNYFEDIPSEKNNSLKILLCAPSGKAAFLIGGVTLHTAFALPITQYGGQMPELSADVANTIRENLFELKLFIIDEISMVGSTMFSRIDTRLRQIMGRNTSFGGVSVLMVGDLYQLPPVMDTSIYLCPKSCMLSLFSENVLWNEFDYFELTEIMRQKEDKTFIETLNNLARGTMSENNIALIKSRETSEKNVPKDAIILYADNRSVDSFNQLKINLKNGKAYECIAKDTVLGKVSSKLRNKLLTSLKKKKRTECGGLAYKVVLKVGIKYMIVTNIDVENGLVNGACGILKNITFKPGTNEPIKIWLDFNNNKIGVEQRRPYIKYMTENYMEMCLVPLSPLSVVLNINERMGGVRKDQKGAREKGRGAEGAGSTEKRGLKSTGERSEPGSKTEEGKSSEEEEMRREVAGWRGEKAEEAAAEERKASKGVKEGGEEERRIVWDRGEMIGRWVEEEARRRVKAAGTRGGLTWGEEQRWREMEEVGRVECKTKGGGSQKEAERRESEESEKTRRLKERVKRLEEEREQRERRKRNVVWRGLDGRDAEERRGLMERVAEKVLGKVPKIRRVWERRGAGGRDVLIVKMEDEKERADLLGRYGEFRQRWGIGVDEDLTMEERKARWRLLKKAREERERGRRTRVENRRIWVEEKEIVWNKDEGKLEEK